MNKSHAKISNGSETTKQTKSKISYSDYFLYYKFINALHLPVFLLLEDFVVDCTLDKENTTLRVLGASSRVHDSHISVWLGTFTHTGADLFLYIINWYLLYTAASYGNIKFKVQTVYDKDVRVIVYF